MRSSPRTLALHGAVVVALVGGATAFVTFDNTVRLSVDGKAQTVHTFGRTVGEVLRSKGLAVGTHDAIAPSVDSRVQDGTEINLRYGRPLTLTLDGEQRDVWVTASSVDAALGQLGIREQGAYVSASRSLGISRRGLDLKVNTAKRVTLVDGPAPRSVTTTANTVAALFDEQGVVLDADDVSLPAADSKLTDGASIAVHRYVMSTLTVDVAVPHDTTRREDPKLAKDQTKTVTKGADGTKTQTFTVTTENSVEVKRDLVSEVISKAPVTAVVSVGTKAAPVTAPAPAPGAPAVAATADGLNWAALAKCESGGNPRAVNPAGYYGLYQFSLSTWRGVGGSGNPIDASPDEQLARAQILYNRSGAGQWGCGRHLFD